VLVLGLALLAVQLTGGGGTKPTFPDRPKDAMEQPIGHPPRVDDAGTYAFVRTQPKDKDEPVTYDPCVPVHVVVNERTAVPGADGIVRQAIESVSEATGLSLVLDGRTNRQPDDERRTTASPDGARSWRPVLIAWSDPKETPALKGLVAGVGGSTAVRRDGHEWFVTGGVSLDGPQLRRLLRSEAGRTAVRAVVMHELGHVVGLDHVKDRAELMYATGSEDVTDWGPGDRAGLAALGGGECIDY
jgi:hypothetical protein